MTNDTGALDRAAERLDTAQHTAEAVEQLPGGLTPADAYAIQDSVIGRRLARGERPAGLKLGFTSKAKMEQMGVSEVIVGRLTDAMRVPDGGEVALDRFIHPRVEPEVAYRIARDVTPDDGELAVDAVAPALEIIDSRYRDFRFSLPDVIADNASSAGFVIGSWQPAGVDLDDLAVRLTVNGDTVETGSTSAILGHPDRALPALLEIARRQGMALRAGDVVLAGGATAAAPFPPGRVVADVAGLGSVSAVGRRG
ncbi:fumarylacetoacetate hydrolase family protein [Actinomadura madurae]|uniref:2-oxo-3-hexenedioate decarboxylase n=1 Tax=Actinomadura madurae TaxID=1993 RepID=A0A1I5GNM9_9ACTN|nr:fumarylacetoacetate hydrolase family protein [Actinomadura madurae]SFO37562.1 2-oxo-3-hexenedioate decarboxylase [Actinomadura madurae]SPT51430.1 4-oxalocrotonate decarboxylase [Actinomadura madurae]